MPEARAMHPDCRRFSGQFRGEGSRLTESRYRWTSRASPAWQRPALSVFHICTLHSPLRLIRILKIGHLETFVAERVLGSVVAENRQHPLTARGNPVCFQPDRRFGTDIERDAAIGVLR